MFSSKRLRKTEKIVWRDLSLRFHKLPSIILGSLLPAWRYARKARSLLLRVRKNLRIEDMKFRKTSRKRKPSFPVYSCRNLKRTCSATDAQLLSLQENQLLPTPNKRITPWELDRSFRKFKRTLIGFSQTKNPQSPVVEMKKMKRKSSKTVSMRIYLRSNLWTKRQSWFLSRTFTTEAVILLLKSKPF